MTEYVFVRHSTSFLLILVAVLSCVCLGLVVAMFSQHSCHTDSPNTKSPLTSSTDVTHSTANTRSSSPTLPTSSTDSTTETPTAKPWEENYRIPRDIYPHNYRLFLHPNLETGLFNGSVKINISMDERRDFLVVHSKYLNIHSTKLSYTNDRDKKEIKITEVFEYEPNEFWVVRTSDMFGPANVTLSLDFSGNLTRSIVGFYRSVYTNKDTGKKRYIATTKFQPTFARRAFPCYDEPSFKSTFEVSLVKPSNDDYIALSNMPVQNVTEDQPSLGLSTVSFVKSVPMVTYLACFIVCDFSYIEHTTDRGVVFKVYAPSDRLEAMSYAGDVGANITDYFENYFNVTYPLPKQDMIAIPDFVSGAMEHWGLITYRETNLQYNSTTSSSYNHQRVATVISHELAHQWFGNLVTLKWWNDLWLNEGFASYIEYKGVDQYHPDWNMMLQFLVSDLFSVMQFDATLSSHPIVQPVDTPDQITAIFDRISYSKGASVLRMLESFMGEEEFRRGIANFLQRYAYKNAVTQNLWDELESVSSQNLKISRIMDTWTKQMGFPVLTVAPSHDGSRVQVTQKRFLEDPDANSSSSENTESPFGYSWDIPVTYSTESDNTVKTAWFHYDTDSIELPINDSELWYKVNVGHTGYYRVNYDIATWRKLIQTMIYSTSEIPIGDRASLLSDGFAMAKAGYIAYNVTLEMMSYLRSEQHYAPWSTAYDEIVRMLNLLKYTDVYQKFRTYILELVSSHFDRLGLEDEGTHLEKRTRVLIAKLACKVGYEPCLRGAEEMMSNWLADSEIGAISANMRTTAYTYGMQEIGSPGAWDTVWNRYINETNAQEKSKLAVALASVKVGQLLKKFVQLAKNEGYVRSQDYFTVLANIAANSAGTEIVWDFFRNEWQSYLVPRFSLNERYLGFLVPRITKYFSNKQRLQEMTDFFAKNPEAGAGERSRREALEQTRANINWLKRYQTVISAWLDDN